MSTRLYRRVAAAALVTTVGLSLAACGSSKSDSASGGKTTITVDCPPLKTDNGGKSLEELERGYRGVREGQPHDRHRVDLGRRPV